MYSFVLSLILLICCTVPAEGTTVAGVVVTEKGFLDGAIVKAFSSLQDALADSNPLISTTGKRPGFFSLNLPAGVYHLTATGSDKENKYFSYHGANPIKIEEKPVWLPFAATPISVPVQYAAEMSTIVGRVVYKGKPVSEAQVSLYSLDEKNIRGLGLQTKSTGLDGSFRFSVQPADYILIARKRMEGKGKMPLKRGDLFCFYGANPLTVADAREATVEIYCNPKDDQQSFLEPDVTIERSLAELAHLRGGDLSFSERGITGRVLTTDGTPIKNIQVTAYLRDPDKTFQMHHLRLATGNMVITDRDGRYFLPISKAGSYYLVAREYSGESPLKGEYYGLYEGNSDNAVIVNESTVSADISVSRVMEAIPLKEAPAGNSRASSFIVKASSVIDRDTLWSGEVFVEGAVLVARTATLKIAPGTTIRFKRIDRDGDGVGDGELRVTGRIIARGTPEKPIRFMSAEDNPRPGDWSYLLLFTARGENVIEFATFEHAFTGLQIHFSRAVIRDSVFSHNIEGLRFGRAELDIEHNEISYNDIGIRYHRLEGPVQIQRNSIKKNGVGLFLVPSSQRFVDFSLDAYTPDLRYFTPPLISDNTIADNVRYNYQLGERLASDVTIGGNWWGGDNKEEIRSTIFDRERDQDLGRVIIHPILSVAVQNAGPRKGGR